MSTLDWLLLSFALVALLYAAALAALLLAGRRADARALVGFVPDCIVLIGRLLRDRRVPRWRKAALALLAGYLALPFDLVPDFIPVVGQLDDAILAALVLRLVLRGAGPDLLTEHWPGPPEGRRVIAGLAWGRAGRTSTDQAESFMGSGRRSVLLVAVCLFGGIAIGASASGASARSDVGSGGGALSEANVRSVLSSLPYEVHFHELKPPARDTAAFRGHAIGPFRTVMKFTIGVGQYAIPLPGIGTRFAVSNGEAGFVFNSNASEGKDFTSKNKWEEVGKMEVTVEERLCRRATGNPCPV
jgi:hypothetical protein